MRRTLKNGQARSVRSGLGILAAATRAHGFKTSTTGGAKQKHERNKPGGKHLIVKSSAKETRRGREAVGGACFFESANLCALCLRGAKENDLYRR